MIVSPSPHVEGETSSDIRFRLNETVDDAFHRVIGRLTDAMLASLTDPMALGIDESVHTVRKTGKQVRALLRLVRPSIRSEFKAIDRSYGDAGRLLASARDARIVVDVFDELFPADDPTTGNDIHQAVRSTLDVGAIAEATAVFEGEESPAIEALRVLQAGAAHASTLHIPERASSIADGATRTYSQGREDFHRLSTDPTPTVFHKWRIRVKQRRHQVAYLEGCAPSDLGNIHQHLHELSDLLGAAHDLVVFQAHLEVAASELPTEETGQMLAVAIGRRTHLESQALHMGAELFASSPEQMNTSLIAIWEAWEANRH